MQRVLKIFLAILLIVLAQILLIVLSVVALFFGIYLLIFKKDKRNVGNLLDDWFKYLVSIAASIDQTGNAAVGKLLTAVLVDTSKDHSIHVDIDDTISEITGWNELTGGQTKTGKILSKILNTVEKEHGLKSAANAYWKSLAKVKKYKHLENKLLKFKK